MVKKKPARKPTLTLIIQEQIRTEYSLGAGVRELARKYDRGKSIISRLVNGISRADEELATKLAIINQEIGTRKGHEKHLIIQRSEQIQKIIDGTIKGTNYIALRTLKKLKKLSDDKITFNDLSQAQGVMVKAHSMAVPKVESQVNINNITGIKLIDN